MDLSATPAERSCLSDDTASCASLPSAPPHDHVRCEGSSTPCIHGGVHSKSYSEGDVPLTSPISASEAGAERSNAHILHNNPPPQHHAPHGQVDYARIAKEEMDDVRAHPPGSRCSLASSLPDGKTGVAAWDRVKEHLPSKGGARRH